ncbi:MAG: helix-turn-helix domain-containing protein [Armatimonadota bacterium]
MLADATTNMVAKKKEQMTSTNLLSAFGEVVKQQRLAQGFSQESFARRCGIHRTYMTHIERGMKMPSIDVAQRLAWGLGLEVSELFAQVEAKGATVKAILGDSATAKPKSQA